MSIVLDRLKAQLLSSGVQQENFALFQVISQLIDVLRGEVSATQQAISGGSSGSGGLVNATYLTKNKELGLPNSLQTLAGSGIQFNDSKGRRIISAALPFAIDGEDGLDGLPGLPGKDGITGMMGLIGPPGMDGESGEDGPPGPPGINGIIGVDGAPGAQGLAGAIGLDGEQGEEGPMGFPGPPGPQGLTGGNSGVTLWFNITDDSDIAGYKIAQLHPAHNAEATIVQVCAGTGNNLIVSFATPIGVPGVYAYQDGKDDHHIHSAVTTVGGFARYLIEVYYCNADGTGETLIGSSYSDSTTDTSIDELNFDLYNLDPVILTATQRLVYKLYVARVSGPANVSVTTYFEGLVHQSYTNAPISGNVPVPGPQGIQGIIGPPGLDAEEPEHPYIIPGPAGAGGGGGSSILTGTFASIPAAGTDGRLYMPSDHSQIYRDNGAAWEPWASLKKGLSPVSGDFTWVNQGAASLVDSFGNGLSISAPANAAESLKCLVRAIPSAAPWTIICRTRVALAPANYQGSGVIFRESASGKIVSHGWYYSAAFLIKNYKWTNATTYSAAYADPTFATTYAGQFAQPWWWKIQDDNTNRIVSFSPDGVFWYVAYSVGRTDFLTADQWGFMANPSNVTYGCSITLMQWAVG